DGLGNIFIADTGHHRVRRVDAVTGLITTVAGTGAAGFSGNGGLAKNAQLSSPKGVFIETTGSLLIADSGNFQVRRVDAITGIITAVAGSQCGVCPVGDGGPALSAQLSPTYAMSDAVGNVYIADQTNHRIRKVNNAGIISTVAGTGVTGFSGDGG